MKRTTKRIALLALLSLFPGLRLHAAMQSNVSGKTLTDEILPDTEISTDTVAGIDSTYIRVRELHELLEEINSKDPVKMPIIKITGPWIFTGYRHLNQHKKFEMDKMPVIPGLEVATWNGEEPEIEATEGIPGELGELSEVIMTPDSVITVDSLEETDVPGADMTVFSPDYVPDWLRDAIFKMRLQDDLIYTTMIDYPNTIDYTYWTLPVPPSLPEDDLSFQGYLKKLNLPEISAEKAVLPEEQPVRRIYWLHTFNSMAQFSQAFISPNWYQGGNNHLSLLMGVSWNVQLNQVYYPNLLFQSNLSYKLGINSTPQDQVHKYSISEDLLQWNLNAGLKALKKWYYSFNAVFKTQLMNNYPANSKNLKAAFLSPGDLNLGLGMSYSHKNDKVQLTATISPLSYNLKTCISDKIDHKQFNISPDAKTHSEFGSNAEINMSWKIRYNINYQTRLFLFTDYKYELTDWEQTFNFEINKFLSTQLYLRMRYDTSIDSTTGWKRFMLREVLSFGLSYTFSTK